MTTAVAYAHGPTRVYRLANEFTRGAHLNGVKCSVEEVEKLRDPLPVDVVWMYGLGPACPVFEAYEGKATRIVGDRGYFDEYIKNRRFWRVSVNSQQPDKHLQLIDHSSDRYKALGLNVQPVIHRGDYILICGIGPKQAARLGYEYGQWEKETYAALCKITKRRIFIREKPGNPWIMTYRRLPYPKLSQQVRGAWAVVCRTGNVGADCILENVPVIAEAGPGRVYYPDARLEDIDSIRPIDPDLRVKALSDLTHWQWTNEEIERGDMWRQLMKEGIV